MMETSEMTTAMGDFLNKCCRICLAIENVMINTFDRIENFEETICELLYEYVNIEITPEDVDPKLICEDCANELVMVAKFHQKCKTATDMLLHLKVTAESKPSSATFAVEIIDDNTLKPDQIIVEEHEEEQADSFEEKQECVKAENHDDDYEYVIFDENTSLRRERVDTITAATANDSFIEEADDLFVVAEYLNSDSEELTDANKNDVDEDDPLHDQLHRAKRRRIEFGSPKTTAKININHCCKICGAGFAQLSNLTRHLATHTNMAPDDVLACGTCNQTFEDVNDLSAHIREQECSGSVEARPPAPTVVNKSGKEKKLKKKPHICEYCKKGFSSTSLLVTHVRVHTGERPYACTICDKKFATQGGLDLHVRRHSGYKPYRCNECDRGFAESSNLKVHMRIHTGEKPHKCTRCDRSFSRVFLLQIHQRTHTGERPYGCEVCSKSFAQQGDLASHKRIHSGERPHICKICSKGFIKSSGLTMHMKRHRVWDSTTNIDKEDSMAEKSNDDSETIEAIDDNVYVLFDGFNDNIRTDSS